VRRRARSPSEFDFGLARANGPAWPFRKNVVFQKELMGRETVYLVQAFVAGRGDNLKAEPPIPCKSAERACRLAESLADSKCGVVAFSSSGDAELGDYDDEPTIILKIGRLPADFD
jgi:hypothetical protein